MDRESFREQICQANDIASAVEQHIAQVFTGLMTRQLGEEQFTVESVGGKE